MVIIKRIFSDKELFEEVEFHKGINIVRGVYKRNKKGEDITDLNGIGKSTLIRLIDFALLSQGVIKKHFDVKNHPFLKNSSVILEFEADGKTYFIKRNFETPKNPHFGMELNNLEKYEEDELKRILGKIFFLDKDYDGDFDTAWYRDLVKFFIKDDLNHFERDDPLNFVFKTKRKFKLYTYNLFLLGLPNKSISIFDELKYEKESLNKQKKEITDRIKDETGKKIEEIKSEISLLDARINNYENSIKEYKFIDSYKEVENELISISVKVSSLLDKIYFFERRLREYIKSYEYDIEIDAERVSKIYNNLDENLGKVIKSTLEEVLEFRKKLSENRKLFLKGKEMELKEEIEKLRKEVMRLEERRSELYKLLDEKKVLDSIKNTYTLLIEEKTKKERWLTVTSQIEGINDKINNKNIEISQKVSDISKEMNEIKPKIDKIANLFFSIVKDSIRVNDITEAIFDISSNPSNQSPLEISIDVPKSEALGKNRFKILAYDLTVFINGVREKRKLPRFLIHDGVFHGMDKKIMIRVLNLMHSEFLKNQDFQYIITANENEINVPSGEEDIYGKYTFDLDKSTVATYEDEESKMIFKKEY